MLSFEDISNIFEEIARVLDSDSFSYKLTKKQLDKLEYYTKLGLAMGERIEIEEKILFKNNMARIDSLIKSHKSQLLKEDV